MLKRKLKRILIVDTAQDEYDKCKNSSEILDIFDSKNECW